MTVQDTFPRPVRDWRNVRIPMPDGATLAARVWLPEDAEQDPVPAILEYIPYRQNDATAPRDALHHPYFAGHGYAGVRVDLRGSGDSDGVLTDEYLEQELADGEAVIAWLREQPWCDGSVGVIGISWGGFNGLQLAARRPPGLRAVITAASSDDRYTDDVHYMGGCLLTDNLSWASTMFAFNSLPPDPENVGPAWRDMWRERLEGSGLWLATWLRHQHRDDYWRFSSVCEDYAAIEIPVLAVSGWADGYTNAVFRMLEAMPHIPRKGLVGPWSHTYPHIGQPGPAIDFLGECLRWWDRWLKDIDTGVERDPMLTCFLEDAMPPQTAYAEKAGAWISEPTWPPESVSEVTYPLGAHTIWTPDAPSDDRHLMLSSPLTVGLYAGKWCAYAAGPDLAGDQRAEDGGCLVFETEPLDEDLVILGRPRVDLTVTPDAPVAMVAARLSDVMPDGQAARVSYGLLNLCHRDGHDHPKPLAPGETHTARVSMNDAAKRFRAGHRLRLSLSTSYWPLAWPAPAAATLSVHLDGTTLTLPVRRADAPDGGPFDGPRTASPLAVSTVTPGESTWRVEHDLTDGRSTLHVFKDDGRRRLEDDGLEMWSETHESYSVHAGDFASPRGETLWRRGFERDGWRVETVTRTVLTCDAARFHVRAELDAYEGDVRVWSRNWDESIPRRLV